MANIPSRKSTMTLYTSPTCVLSHGVRLVLHEKGVVANIEFFDPSNPPEDVLEINPNGTSPILVERDLVLYDSRIIMEYLDERFPHPPLHPLDPISRAKSRMIIKRIDQDWYKLLDEMQNSGEKKSAKAKRRLKENLIAAAPIFAAKPYFMSDEYSLIDCIMAPLLWKIKNLGINMTPLGKTLNNYTQRLFAREAFVKTTEDAEKHLTI